ncbi:hypothetical protein Ddye_030284 [Dipteronia dyeriana]|uniref:RNase H type-1 domain-containing protein n=1 Tax=Dipteronia dyeriana TaxID=168575 RepID=A0AAD9WMB9_9ROSI|nr:hypothetical protein Ddye_030284 [Dipteronia dyeriana]
MIGLSGFSRESHDKARFFEVVSGESDGLCFYSANHFSVLGVRWAGCHEQYLGLPSFTGRNRRQFLTILRISWSKIKWRSKLLSVFGKVVLGKAVLQAIPTYTMSLFKLPVRFLEIVRLCSRFWWGSSGEEEGSLDYQVANEAERDRPVVEPELVRWKPPYVGFYKVNMDASIDVANHVAEAVAIRRDIQFAIDTVLTPATVETDALGVANLVNSGAVVSVNFVPRKTNFVAHALQVGSDFSRYPILDGEWETYPPYVEGFVQGDNPLS